MCGAQNTFSEEEKRSQKVKVGTALEGKSPQSSVRKNLNMYVYAH